MLRTSHPSRSILFILQKTKKEVSEVSSDLPEDPPPPPTGARVRSQLVPVAAGPECPPLHCPPTSGLYEPE